MAASDTSRPLVLVVDDTEAVLDLAALSLGDGGFDVLTAASGQEAIGRLRERAGDVALAVVDFHMLGMDGRATAAALREIREDLPVLVVSGESQDVQPKAWGAAPTRFLAKPYRPAQLVATVRSMLAPPA